MKNHTLLKIIVKSVLKCCEVFLTRSFMRAFCLVQFGHNSVHLNNIIYIIKQNVKVLIGEIRKTMEYR